MVNVGIPQSASRAAFLDALGLRSANQNDMAIYQEMLVCILFSIARAAVKPAQNEASKGRDELSRGVVRQSWDQISETAKHRQILDIFERASPTTKYYYAQGQYWTAYNQENWVIRWLLWHVFRYRDNRNIRNVDYTPMVYWDPVRNL